MKKMSKYALYTPFLKQHQLTEAYLVQAEQWFAPLVNETLSLLSAAPEKTLVIGINGCQGSGKSTLANYLRTTLVLAHNIESICVSLDDFYLTKNDRLALAESKHPLLSTRGVPGTHDTALAIQQLMALKEQSTGTVELPVFDKSHDDRDIANPQVIEQPVKVIILEGWCLGAEPQTAAQLETAINTLESHQDANGEWREFVNQALAQDYAELFSLVDCWLMLKAPSFDCVYQWRVEQEQKMAKQLGVDFLSDDRKSHPGIMSTTELQHFIDHYQRITEHGFTTLPKKMHHLYELDTQRKIISHSQPVAMTNTSTRGIK
jgi:D-glycerate 3-kinase